MQTKSSLRSISRNCPALFENTAKKYGTVTIIIINKQGTFFCHKLFFKCLAIITLPITYYLLHRNIMNNKYSNVDRNYELIIHAIKITTHNFCYQLSCIAFFTDIYLKAKKKHKNRKRLQVNYHRKKTQAGRT